MIYVKGSTGSVLIRTRTDRITRKLVCTFLGDGSIVQIDRTSDATFAAGVKALEARIGQLCGNPSIVSELDSIN
jgi:hypothetical protein